MSRDVSFEAAGQVWTLRFGINAIASLEESFDKPVNAIFEELDGKAMRVGMFRTIVQAGLAHHHSFVPPSEAGNLMDEVGLSRIGDLVGAAIKASFPDATPGEAPAGA